MLKIKRNNLDDYGAYLSKGDAALLAGASIRSIDKWRARYGLKSTKIDNFVRIAKADLVEFMERHQQAPSQNQAERPEGGAMGEKDKSLPWPRRWG